MVETQHVLTGIRNHCHFSFILFLGLLVSLSAWGQKRPDTLKLKEVEVKASFQVNNMGYKQVRLDSSVLLPRQNANLGNILSQYSTVFIKSYGNNNLATPAFRGTTAHHTIVEWNGITINSPMLGQIDLSQLPVAQFDGIEILYGAAGLTRTSGAFGGIINLSTSPDWNNRLHVSMSQTFASFDNYNTIVHAEVGTQGIQSHTRFNFGAGKNDFPFYNDYSMQTETLINGAFNQYGFSEDIFAKINNRHLITARFWYTYSHRDIPPLNTNINPKHTEYQIDKSFRSAIEYKYIQHDFSVTVSSALVNDYLHYVNDSLNAEHQYYSFTNRIRANVTGIRNLIIRPGLDLNHDWVNSEAYNSQKQRNLAGGFAEIIYHASSTVSLTALARADIVDGELMPFIPSFGVEYKPFKKVNLSFSGNISKNYRFPSLNDLYWESWGNPDLLPEISYGAEGGATWNWPDRLRRVFLEMELTGYYLLMKDMIVWTPSPESSAIWIPENVSEVASRGIEAGFNSTIILWKTNLDLNIAYNYCRSSYMKETNQNGSSVGNQLIYIPIHTLNASVKVHLHGYYFSYLFNFIGRRYLGKENTAYMPGYNLSNIFFGKSIQLKDFNLSLQVEINNLFDLDYQSIAYRPMPGRNFGITIRGGFNGKSGK